MISLAEQHTFHFPSKAMQFIELTEAAQCAQLCKRTKQQPFYLLGGGSNSVFLEDFEGLVVKVALKGIKVARQKHHWHIRVAAGEDWHQLVAWCVKNEINGLENLALIPGTAGAAPIQNIGAYGVEVSNFLHSVHGVELDSGKTMSLTNEECRLGYRDSIFKKELANKILITEIELKVPYLWRPMTNYPGLEDLKGEPSAKQVFDRVIQIRKQKLPDPAVVGNAGSFFKNPVLSQQQFEAVSNQYADIPSYVTDASHYKVPAAWLIDQCGFKGHKIGNVGCHAKQPLVLFNAGGGKAGDLLMLAREIRDKVYQRFGIELENEVRLIGRTGLVSL